MRAFSLVEVTITVAAIGVMAAAAMPSISRSVQRERDASAAVRVVDSIRAARETARSTLCPAEVEVYGGELTVRSHMSVLDAARRPPGTADRPLAGDGAAGGAAGAATEITPPPCNLDKVQHFDIGATGLRFGEFDFGHCPGTRMQIQEDGTIAGATAHVKLPLKMSDGRVWTVEIWPASGAVRLNRS